LHKVRGYLRFGSACDHNFCTLLLHSSWHACAASRNLHTSAKPFLQLFVSQLLMSSIDRCWAPLLTS
jgi:hypothetical protein